MIELRIAFTSHQEWCAWRERHHPSFDDWRAEILGDIGRHGIVEPLSGVQHPPHAIGIDPANLRESVSVAELNSRKRAGLFAVSLAQRSLPPPRRQRTKVLGAEGVTRAARILRAAFPHFLGAEYLPSDEEQEKHYPIPHLDLMKAAFPDAAFDLFYSGDVLEHVPDVQRALGEIARVLRPGGVMVSTFPFNAASATTLRRASLDPEGTIIHHLSPEYHGNPVRPSEGSLVFAVPGWDILDGAKAAGFADAAMTLILSSTHGIVSAPLPGIFVMTAAKNDDGKAAQPISSAGFSYHGPRLRRCIAIAGLARSGTTLLCSILGVHSRIHPVYEPFNGSKDRTLPPHLGIGDFFDQFPTEMKGKDMLLVKETGTRLSFLDRTADLLRSVAPPLVPDLIVLLRNPFHVFLSMLEAQKKWWGGAHDLSVENFEAWARHNLAALARLLQMAQEFNAVIVSYENLVANKEQLVPMLMQQLGIPFQDRQLNFEKYIDKRQVRGDVTLATSPFSISDERVKDRTDELAQVWERIRDAEQYDRVDEVARIISTMQEIGAARFHNPVLRAPINAMREILNPRHGPEHA